jgi:hypothetical protein
LNLFQRPLVVADDDAVIGRKDRGNQLEAQYGGGHGTHLLSSYSWIGKILKRHIVGVMICSGMKRCNQEERV